MNQKHLEYFIAVVQKGSIKGAARALGLTQPAISSAIRKLEDEFGVPLLLREAQGSGPTLYGRALYSSAETMMSVVESAKRKIAALKDPSEGHLRIGTGPSVPFRGISKIVADILNDYPGLRVDHVTGNSFGDFEQKLLAEDIDLAFCCQEPTSLPRSINSQMVSRNPIGMIMSADHLEPDATSIAREKVFRDFTWIVLRDDEIKPPEGVDRSPNVNFQPQLKVTVDDLTMIKQLTLSSRAIGFFPIEDSVDELESGKFVELYIDGTPPLDRPIYALTRSQADNSATLDLFLDKLSMLETTNASPPNYRRIAIRSE